MPLSGHVEDLALADLLQLGAQHQRTCRIDVRAGSTSGAIFLERGVLVHAFIGSISAEPALRVLLEERDLHFEMHTGARSSLRSMERSVAAALIDAACAQDAYAHGLDVGPAPQAPVASPRPTPPRVVLSAPPPPAGARVSVPQAPEHGARRRGLPTGALLACLALFTLGGLVLAVAPFAQ